MSVNRHRPHVLILPEDDANRQIAKGFELGISPQKMRSIQVLNSSGGWPKVRKEFIDKHADDLLRYPQFHLILLIDFDQQGDDRRKKFTDFFPEGVRERVYVLGTSSEPENLRKELQARKSLENIGTTLADECRTGEYALWNHGHLLHNAGERARLATVVRSILF